MKQLRAERSQDHNELQKAYDELDDAKDDVDSWYRKSERSPWLFGNGGKELPKHSFFGQSFGDLEAAKGRRGDAVDKIIECKDILNDIRKKQAANKREIELNRAEISRLSDRITKAKSDRQRMFDLKKDGVNLDALQLKHTEYISTQKILEHQFLTINEQQRALVAETEYRLGLREREAAVVALITAKNRFIDEFHSEKSKNVRQDHHRRQWLARHGYPEQVGN